MRIAIDCHTLEIEKWAGKEKFLINILNELKSENNDTFVLYFKKKVDLKIIFPKNFLIVNNNIPTPFWQLFVTFDLLIKKVDVILCPCTYLLPVLNIFTKNVIVVHDLTTLLPDTKKTHKLMTRFKEKLLLGLALKNSKKVISVSYSTKNDCVKYFHIKPEKIKVTHLAAHNRFRVIEDKIAISNIAEKYNIKINDYIIFIGTLEPRKNIEGLINAYHIAQNDNSFPSLLIIGKKGWYFEGIFNLVKSLKLEKKVIFADYIYDNDIPYLLNGARFLVYPSFYEGFGLPVLEAMACACPVITSNISSLPEVTGNDALLIDPNSINSIANALIKLNGDIELRKLMLNKGIQRSKNFSWQKTTNEILNILKSINSTK